MMHFSLPLRETVNVSPTSRTPTCVNSPTGRVSSGLQETSPSWRPMHTLSLVLPGIQKDCRQPLIIRLSEVNNAPPRIGKECTVVRREVKTQFESLPQSARWSSSAFLSGRLPTYEMRMLSPGPSAKKLALHGGMEGPVSEALCTKISAHEARARLMDHPRSDLLRQGRRCPRPPVAW